MSNRNHVGGIMEELKITPFSFVSALTETKEDFFEGNEKEYNTFIIDKALSFNLDCLFHVAELNQYQELPKNAHHKYLLYALDKKKRYGRWAKKASLSSDIDLVKEAYGYNTNQAMIALDLMSDKELIELKNSLSKGGRK
jgi:hypothetical protein